MPERPKTSPPSPTRSTTDQEKSLDFEPQPKSSMNNYNQFKTTVLQPPIESKQYVSIVYNERLAEYGIVASTGTVGDSYDNTMAENVNGSSQE